MKDFIYFSDNLSLVKIFELNMDKYVFCYIIPREGNNLVYTIDKDGRTHSIGSFTEKLVYCSFDGYVAVADVGYEYIYLYYIDEETHELVLEKEHFLGNRMIKILYYNGRMLYYRSIIEDKKKLIIEDTEENETVIKDLFYVGNPNRYNPCITQHSYSIENKKVIDYYDHDERIFQITSDDFIRRQKYNFFTNEYLTIRHVRFLAEYVSLIEVIRGTNKTYYVCSFGGDNKHNFLQKSPKNFTYDSTTQSIVYLFEQEHNTESFGKHYVIYQNNAVEIPPNKGKSSRLPKIYSSQGYALVYSLNSFWVSQPTYSGEVYLTFHDLSKMEVGN